MWVKSVGEKMGRKGVVSMWGERVGEKVWVSVGERVVEWL